MPLPENEPHRPTFIQAWFLRSTVLRGLRVAAVVGAVLIAINQGDLILDGGRPPTWKLLLTFLVPYCVSSWSSAAALSSQDEG